MIDTMYWAEDALYLLDQRRLPHEVNYLRCDSAEAISAGISDMVVRGAPAIGVAAAFGVVRAVLDSSSRQSVDWNYVFQKIEILRSSRPTAVNLMWAIDRMSIVIEACRLSDASDVAENCLLEAKKIKSEDIEINRQIGDHGLDVCRRGMRILTYCNAGALATAGYGTALGVIRSAHRELMADNMVGYAMAQGLIDLVVVGTDRVAANGDVANKIGTYTVATMAQRHGIPFYVACPVSTIDFSIASGNQIPIEERVATELTGYQDRQWAPDNVSVLNPAFDVTPSELVTALITEYGIFGSTEDGLKKLKSALPSKLR